MWESIAGHTDAMSKQIPVMCFTNHPHHADDRPFSSSKQQSWKNTCTEAGGPTASSLQWTDIMGPIP